MKVKRASTSRRDTESSLKSVRAERLNTIRRLSKAMGGVSNAVVGSTSANSRQVGGNHYAGPMQHWDFVWENDLDYFQGQITKYVTRWRKKGGMADLQKARHFLDKYIELNSKALATEESEPGPGYVNQD